MGILIVDDSKHFCLLLKGILEKNGFKDVIIAESVPDAFNILGMEDPTISFPKIDLILMDLVMPGTNGIQACIKIKAAEACKDIPVIMVTSVADKKKLQQAFDAGAVDLVAKPMDRDDLLAKVSKYTKD